MEEDTASSSGGGYVSLLDAAAAFSDAEEELAVVTHQQLLRRRFASEDERVVLDSALAAAGQHMVFERKERLLRLKQQEEIIELRAALAESRARAQQSQEKISALEERLSTITTTQQKDDGKSSSQRAALPTPSPDAAASSAVQKDLSSQPSLAVSGDADEPERFLAELRRSRLEAIGGVGSEVKSLLSRALQALSQDLYAGADAVLAELVQNADDARYPTDEASDPPSLCVTVVPASRQCPQLGLLVETNEIGFSAADVRAICDLGASTKHMTRDTTTGRKGLGFKSVFAVSDTPHIFSNGFAFKFDVSGEHGLSGALIPIPIDLSLRSSFAAHRRDANGRPRTTLQGTTIWLPMRDRVPPLRVSASSLLFLRRLQALRIERPGGAAFTIRRVFEGGDADEGNGHVATSEPGGDGRLQHVRVTYEAADGIRMSSYVIWRETALVHERRTEVVLAFRASPPGSSPSTDHVVDDSSQTPTDACDIFAWLPVMRVGLPYLVQADWSLTASRQAIHTDSSWNQALRDAARDILLRAVRRERALAELVHTWLPKPELCHDVFWRPLFTIDAALREVPMLVSESGRHISPADAVLREMAMGGSEHGGASSVAGLQDMGRVSPKLVSAEWLEHATGGKQFVAAECVARMGIDVLERLGCERFNVDTFLQMLESWASEGAGAIGVPIGCGDAAAIAADSRTAWLRAAHAMLHRQMRPDHVRTVRSLPILELSDDIAGDAALVAPNSTPPLFLAGGETSAHVSDLAIGSGALRLLSERNYQTEEQQQLMEALKIDVLSDAAIVRAVATQHAQGALPSLEACWKGLYLVRRGLRAFIEDEAARAEAIGAAAAAGAKAALGWLGGALCVPCTDGHLRAAIECHSRSFLGISCPTCCAGTSRGFRPKQELPPRLIEPGGARSGKKSAPGRSSVPLSRRASLIRPTSGARAEVHDSSSVLVLRESFEGSGSARSLQTTLKCDTHAWSGGRCSASISSGKSAWTVVWRGGEIALGAGCNSANFRQPGVGRFSIALRVSGDGTASLQYAGTASRFEGADIQFGDSITFALDLDAGVLFVAVNHTLLALERGAPLRQRRFRPRSPRGYPSATYFDDEETAEDDADGTVLGVVTLARAAIALPSDVHGADLFPSVAVRRAAVTVSDDDEAGKADVTVQFGAPVAVPSLATLSFRPLATVLAAQRSGGRFFPLVAPPPSFSPAIHPGRDELQWECFLHLLSIKGHLQTSGCSTAQWWTSVQETEPSQLRGLECAVCCEALVKADGGVTDPGLEAVATVCGHRFHSMCCYRWLATNNEPSCPVCRAKLDPERDVRLLSTDPVAAVLSTNLSLLLSQMKASETPSSPSDASARSLSEARTGFFTVGASPSKAAADVALALTGEGAIARSLLSSYATEPRAVSALGCVRVETECGEKPLQESLVRESFPQLRCGTLALPCLDAPPAERDYGLLADLGCAALPSLTGHLKALRAVATAIAQPEAMVKMGASEAARRATILNLYAAVEAAAIEERERREVRSFFASHPLLWGGDAVGFGRTEDALSHAPATAETLGRPDTLTLFPEMTRLLSDVLALPCATSTVCAKALARLAQGKHLHGIESDQQGASDPSNPLPSETITRALRVQRELDEALAMRSDSDDETVLSAGGLWLVASRADFGTGASQTLIHATHMQPMLIEGEHGFGARLTKLFADLRVFEPESLRTLPSLRSWLVAHSLLVPIPDAVQIQPPTTHGELRQAEAPLEALARDVYARVASRREDHTGFVASEMASLSEAELAQTLQVRLCSRIEGRCALHLPAFAGATQVFAPSSVWRTRRLDWCLHRWRSHHPMEASRTTIVISSESAAPLAALAEALDVLLADDEESMGRMTCQRHEDFSIPALPNLTPSTGIHQGSDSVRDSAGEPGTTPSSLGSAQGPVAELLQLLSEGLSHYNEPSAVTTSGEQAVRGSTESAETTTDMNRNNEAENLSSILEQVIQDPAVEGRSDSSTVSTHGPGGSDSSVAQQARERNQQLSATTGVTRVRCTLRVESEPSSMHGGTPQIRFT